MKAIVLLAVPVLFLLNFLSKWLSKKLNIPKATISRAQVLHKRAWGPKTAGNDGNTWGARSLKTYYYITFLYMIDSKWVEGEFLVPKKVYAFSHKGDEGILKHTYTAFRDFEKFKK